MHDSSKEGLLDPILSGLWDLLQQESTALRRLDRDAIESLANEKLALHESLTRVLERERPTRQHAERLEQVKKLALRNQLLIVHAREAVRGIISAATGQPTQTTVNLPTRPAVNGMASRLSVRV